MSSPQSAPSNYPAPQVLSASERARALRQRDAAQRIKQVNIRIPEIWDTTMQMLARELRAGAQLDGFVIRDKKTGRVRTLIV